MKTSLSLPITLALATVAAHLPAGAQDSNATWSALVAPVIEAVDGPPPEKFKAKYRPVAMVDDAPAGTTAGSAFGVPISIVNREQVRSSQLAYFIRFRRIDIQGDTASVAYQQPSSGHAGTVKLSRVGDAWQVIDKTQSHSSSGARMVYGELFDGVPCTDGTEMAGRWNYYHTMTQSLAAGKPFDFSASVPRVCPGKEFPEVLAYRESKAASKDGKSQ